MIRHRQVTAHHRDQVKPAVVHRALGLGAPVPVEGYLPALVLAVLFGLSMDYQVFLVSRMAEEWSRTRDNAWAVLVGQTDTAGVITATAAIMIAVFITFVFMGARLVPRNGPRQVTMRSAGYPEQGWPRVIKPSTRLAGTAGIIQYRPPPGFSRRPSPAMPTSTVVTTSGSPARCSGKAAVRIVPGAPAVLRAQFYSAIVFFAAWKASSASPGVS
jgi:hypothetical protein